MKVVFCTDGVFPHQVGGMQRHTKLLVEALVNSGREIEVHVIHSHVGIQVYDAAFGVVEHAVEGIDAKKNYLRESKRYSKRVYAVLKTLPKEFIIYNQGLAVWYGIEEFSTRVISNPHGLEPYQSMSAKDKLIAIPFKHVFGKLFSKSRYTVSLGGRLTDILRKAVPEDRIAVLPNATDPLEGAVLKSKPEAKQPLSFFFIARFAANKGIHVLMEAISQLNDEGYTDKLNFILGGKGPLYTHYKKTCTLSNVQLLGFVSDEDLTQCYADADAFVFPTLFEGMPTVVLESMRNYLPIIVSDTGATGELVNSENGYLIEAGNVDSLKKAIVDYFECSAAKKDEMSRQSFDRFNSNFTWEKVALKHLEVFEKLAKELS
jgi:glycosyltransferase involved in cell wall biosynthesis